MFNNYTVHICLQARLSRCFIGEREVCAFAGQAPLQGKESLGRAMARSATEDDVLP
jgi:hypothetical protein